MPIPPGHPSLSKETEKVKEGKNSNDIVRENTQIKDWMQ